MPKNLGKSIRQPNKTWVDKGSQFYNRSMKSWLQDNNMELYAPHNEGKDFVRNSLLEPRKIKPINIWLQFQENMYIVKLDDIVSEYNNTYNSAIKLNLADVRSST